MSAPADDGSPTGLTRLPSWLLTQTAVHAHRLVADRLATVGARGYHFRVLTALAESGPASQATLGSRTGIYLSDLVATINELAEENLVSRAPDPSDRRRNIVTITPAGRRQRQRLDRLLTQVQDELLAPLSPADRDQLISLLSRVLAHHTDLALAAGRRRT